MFVLLKKNVSTQLSLTYKAKAENLNEADFDLNKSPTDSSTAKEEKNSFYWGEEPANVFGEMQSEKKKEKMKQVKVDGDAYDADTKIYGEENRNNMLKVSMLGDVKKRQIF